MPMTEQKIRQLLKEQEEGTNSHGNLNDWAWPRVANPDTVVQVDDTGFYMGKKELAPLYDKRAFTKLRQEWQEPTNIYLNAPVDGIHTVMTNVKFTRDKAYFEGLAKDTLHEAHIAYNDDGKILHMSIFPADEPTKQWAAKLVEIIEKNNGVPEGGFPEAKAKYLEVARLSKIAGGENLDLNKMGEMVDDGVEYVDGMGGVFFGKEKYLESIRRLHAMHYRGFDVIGPIHTPNKNSAYAECRLVFEGLPESVAAKPGSTKDPLVRIFINFHPDTGKITRLGSFVTTFGGAEFGRGWVKWAKEVQEKMMEKKQRGEVEQEGASVPAA